MLRKWDLHLVHPSKTLISELPFPPLSISQVRKKHPQPVSCLTWPPEVAAVLTLAVSCPAFVGTPYRLSLQTQVHKAGTAGDLVGTGGMGLGEGCGAWD